MFKKQKFSISTEEKKCDNCVYSKKIPNMAQFLCSNKGIVSSDYKCRKHSYDITKIATPRKHVLKLPIINPKDLMIDND